MVASGPEHVWFSSSAGGKKTTEIRNLSTYAQQCYNVPIPLKYTTICMFCLAKHTHTQQARIQQCMVNHSFLPSSVLSLSFFFTGLFESSSCLINPPTLPHSAVSLSLSHMPLCTLLLLFSVVLCSLVLTVESVAPSPWDLRHMRQTPTSPALPLQRPSRTFEPRSNLLLFSAAG